MTMFDEELVLSVSNESSSGFVCEYSFNQFNSLSHYSSGCFQKKESLIIRLYRNQISVLLYSFICKVLLQLIQAARGTSTSVSSLNDM